MKKSKIVLILVLLGFIFSFFFFDLSQYLTLEYLKTYQSDLQSNYESHKFLFAAVYFFVYVLVTALSFPGATILTLGGGAIFGLGLGLALVSFASSVGASCAFLISRYFFKSSIESRYKKQFDGINEGIKKDGAMYLLSLRLIPLFPFFIINMLMGITKMRLGVFYIISQIGMLPGTAVYVNAGQELSSISSLKGILSPSVLLSFALLGLFPLFAKVLVNLIKGRKVYAKFRSQKPKSFDYNLVAIGAGAGGLVSSYIGAAVKAKVALIEKHKMGGDCLNTGCVPSKALIKAAKIRKDISKASDFGLSTGEAQVDFKKLMSRIQQVITDIEPHDSIERYTSLGVDCIQGTAKILSPWEIEVNGKRITTKNIVIATGGSPVVPPFKNLELVREKVLTSENLWNLSELPKKLVVLGAGPIGCELAQSFARLGSEVHIVDMADKLLPREEEAASLLIANQFKKEGIKLYLGNSIEGFELDNGQPKLLCNNQSSITKIDFDYAICALGRKANTSGFGLEELKIELNKNGTIKTNEYLQTTFPNIYAVGDVAGPYQFTHTASHMAWYASVNALFFNRFKVDYRVIPWCTFVDPEIARLGMSESEAVAQDIAFDVYEYGIDDLDRAIADGTDLGFVKVLTQKNSDKILGVTIVGASAGETIAEFVLAMKYNLGLNKILGTIHLYPSMAEANKYVAGVWKNKTKPEGLLKYVKAFHAWRRS